MAESSGNGIKALGGIMAVLAILATVVGAIAYFVRPVKDGLDSVVEQRNKESPKLDIVILNKEKISQLAKDHDNHRSSGGHPSLSERVKALEANGVSARHRDRLIRLLWKKIYGEELPAVDGGH